MNKTIKSGVREMLFRMIPKFEEKQQEKEALFNQKQDCLRVVLDFIKNLKNVAGVDDIVKTIEKLTALEQKDRIRTQNQYLDEIASMTEVSIATLKRRKKEGVVNEGVWNTPGKKRPHKPTVSNLDSFDKDAIRNKINEYYIVRKQVPTLRTLLVELKESIGFTGCRKTLRHLLLSNGYEFKRNKNERSLLIERYDIAAWRHRFLRTIALKRRERKSIIYLDETNIHKSYKPKKSWQGPSTSGAIENVSSGKRYIIVHAGSEKGPVPNSLLIFSTKSKMADYHHDIDAVNFNKWLREKLIPNLNEPRVMDNPTEPIYEADELLKQNGYEVLRLPPYYCDLNAIELVWSLAKRKVASINIALPAVELDKLIKESFESITPQEWKKNTDHIIHIENKYKERDRILENNLESFIINIGDIDSSGSNESFHMEMLDSDYDSE
ncbi:unnamed protein product, partial [Brenthis ino]